VSKYGNVRQKIAGYTFDSLAEANRYLVLRQMESDGEIARLEVHPRFSLDVNGTRVCEYIGDFRYSRGTMSFVEDVKGVRTDVYKLKKKLMLAILRIPVIEIDAEDYRSGKKRRSGARAMSAAAAKRPATPTINAIRKRIARSPRNKAAAALLTCGGRRGG
jgi:hypothetical protein